MEELRYIQDGQLPLVLNFNSLREEGLAYVQEYGGNQWTNLNTSDPGITILDQLCYALTELGYCGNFPMKDLLTNAEGQLEVKNQFFLPEDILTTSPITPKDYIKYILDTIKTVQNVVIEPLPNTAFLPTPFRVYLSINPQITNESELNAICRSVFFLLNSARNLGTFFLMPNILEPLNYTVQGDLKIKKGYQVKNVMAKIQYAINDYIFPKVVQAGYDKLRDEGYTADQIFNGPILQNGWTPNTKLKPKKNTIQAFEITEVIALVKGVEAVNGVNFKNADNTTVLYEVKAGNHQIIVLNSIGTLDIENKGQLSENQLQNELNYTAVLAGKAPETDQVAAVSALQRSPQLPVGTFRDIPSYISIQQTMPAIYAVGQHAVNENSSDLTIAQSRQLKGYLTLFDQVLANEFAQLASLGQLFSFKNGDTGLVTETATARNTKDQKKLNDRYPVPFKNFSPTYFYQSLYDSVPDLEPLLKNNNTFRFSYTAEPERELDNNAWEDYKEDPYNGYIHGLLSISEEDTVNLDRRNNILDHLLARHGTSPLFIDDVIEGAPYSGNSLKDRVIIKSMLLQNFDQLSYYRTKAYNYSAATKLSSEFRSVTKKMQQRFLQGFEKDFIVTDASLTQETRISAQDYIDYSAVELKLSLLFALRARYQNYLATHANKLALWLVEQRKGSLFIETHLLLSSADFRVCIAQEQEKEMFYKVQEKLNYDALVAFEVDFLENPENAIQNLAVKGTQATKTIALNKVETCDWDKDGFVPLGETGYSMAIQASWDGVETLGLNDPLLQNDVLVLFPDFIPSMNTDAFKNNVAFFLENELPIALSSNCYYLAQKTLESLVTAFADWHNSLIFHIKEEDTAIASLATSTGKLVAQLKQLNTTPNG